MPTVIMTNQSTLTDRYQTTIPESVRQVLGLKKRDKIQYEIEPDGRVFLYKAMTEQDVAEDPVVDAFLSFLEKDMVDHPEHIKPLSAKILQEAVELTKDVDINLDAPLEGND